MTVKILETENDNDMREDNYKGETHGQNKSCCHSK